MFRKLGYIEGDHHIDIPGGDRGPMDLMEKNGDYAMSVNEEDRKERLENSDNQRPEKRVFGVNEEDKFTGQDIENPDEVSPVEMKCNEEYRIFEEELSNTAIMNW